MQKCDGCEGKGDARRRRETGRRKLTSRRAGDRTRKSWPGVRAGDQGAGAGPASVGLQPSKEEATVHDPRPGGGMVKAGSETSGELGLDECGGGDARPVRSRQLNRSGNDRVERGSLRFGQGRAVLATRTGWLGLIGWKVLAGRRALLKRAGAGCLGGRSVGTVPEVAQRAAADRVGDQERQQGCKHLMNQGHVSMRLHQPRDYSSKF